MISVSISINGEPIFARSARNQSEYNEKGETKYFTDAGVVIWHDYKMGAIPLAKKMLDSINEEMKQMEATKNDEIIYENAEKYIKEKRSLIKAIDDAKILKREVKRLRDKTYYDLKKMIPEINRAVFNQYINEIEHDMEN